MNIFDQIEYYEIGSAPLDENCVQVSKTEFYEEEMKEECNKYLRMLEQRFPNLPSGMLFKVKCNLHEFGKYYEVCLIYSGQNEDHIKAMLFIEEHLPLLWKDSSVFEELKKETVL